MAASPKPLGSGLVVVTVLANGHSAGDLALVSVTVTRQVNVISRARLVFQDGSMPDQSFELSDTDTLAPGAEIEIRAGYEEAKDTLFKGLVIRHGIEIARDGGSHLIVECRDAAVRMTVARRNAVHVDQTDSDVAKRLIGGYAGLQARVDATADKHAELVQYHCTDWDYLLSRAEVNGQVVIVSDGSVSVAEPAVSDAPVLTVTYGEDLISFQADLDARDQLSGVGAVAWDPAVQKNVVVSPVAPSELNRQGNIDSKTLAKVLGLEPSGLQTSTPLPNEPLQRWATAAQTKAGLARIRGRMSFDGSALAVPGSLIEVQGVGERFNGEVYAGAVHHRIAEGSWLTEIELGLSPTWFVETHDVQALPASGYLPSIGGLHIGLVDQLDQDPANRSRVRVQIPVLGEGHEPVWARLVQRYASAEFGAFVVPEIGDEVVLGFFNDDPSHAVILGSLYSSKHPPPYPMSAENEIKGFVSRSRIKLEIEEEEKRVMIETPAGNRVTLDEKEQHLLVEDQHGNTMTFDKGGIVLDSPKDIRITAKGKIELSATGNVEIESAADVTSSGMNIAQSADVGFSAKGGASAELSASGQTTVKGAMVMIN